MHFLICSVFVAFPLYLKVANVCHLLTGLFHVGGFAALLNIYREVLVISFLVLSSYTVTSAFPEVGEYNSLFCLLWFWRYSRVCPERLPIVKAVLIFFRYCGCVLPALYSVVKYFNDVQYPLPVMSLLYLPVRGRSSDPASLRYIILDTSQCYCIVCFYLILF